MAAMEKDNTDDEDPVQHLEGDELANAIEDMITYLECSKPPKFVRSIKGSAGKMFVPIGYFDGAVPFHIAPLKDQTDYFLTDVTPRDINGWDFTSIVSSSLGGSHYNLWRFRKVPLSALRGKCRPISPFVGELAGASVTLDGEYTSYRELLNWSDRDKDWKLVTVHADSRINIFAAMSNGYKFGTSKCDDDLRTVANISLGAKITSDYWWTVTFRAQSSLGIRLPTDAAGAKEALRMRDVPEGRSRRAALRHWVRHHLRNKQSQDPTPVREHLRGAVECDWFGLHCTIAPSPFDLRRAAASAEKNK